MAAARSRLRVVGADSEDDGRIDSRVRAVGDCKIQILEGRRVYLVVEGRCRAIRVFAKIAEICRDGSVEDGGTGSPLGGAKGRAKKFRCNKETKETDC